MDRLQMLPPSCRDFILLKIGTGWEDQTLLGMKEMTKGSYFHCCKNGLLKTKWVQPTQSFEWMNQSLQFTFCFLPMVNVCG